MKLIDFFIEVSKLKKIKRQGWIDSNISEPESVADHAFRTAILSMFMPNNLDKDRMIKIALVHDLGEVDKGDITPYDGISKEQKHIYEKDCIVKLSASLPSNTAEELLSLWNEYEDQKTEEAKLVKQLDILEMAMQAYEYELEQGNNIDIDRWNFWKYCDEHLKNPMILKLYNDLKSRRKWNQ
jgi:putative hydrolase of HD superfamily